MATSKPNQSFLDLPGHPRIGVFSEELRQAIEQAQAYHADRSHPVLIAGDAGAGKEFITHLVHHGDGVCEAPFISVNCAAIAPSLLESDLFGYAPGPKQEGAKGKLELARGGALFLDEIGDLPKDLQPKLMQVLTEKTACRVGGDKPISLDVRIIATTKWDLRVLVEEGRFRLDLYRLLDQHKITVPALWRQREAILPLARMFLNEFSTLLKRDFQDIDHDAAVILEKYPWPGNVRELRNTMERVALLHNGATLMPEHLAFLNQYPRVEIPRNEIGMLQPGQVVLPEEEFDLQVLIEEIILKAVDKFDGNRNKAAQYLGLSWNTLNNRLKKISRQ